MKDMNLTKFKNKEGKEEQFRIVNGDIQFERFTKFLMGANDFIVCCVNVSKIPITSESARKEIYIGEDHDYKVYVSRTKVNESEGEETIQIILKKEANDEKCIKFTVDELVNILEAIQTGQDGELLSNEDTGLNESKKDKAISDSIDLLARLSEVVSQVVANLESM